MRNQNPKRHHYVPQFILRQFADDDGQLWFWRRQFKRGEVRKSSTRNLFAEKDLYSLQDGSGKKDVSLEHFFSKQEYTLSLFLEKLKCRVSGELNLEFSNEEWNHWHFFIYYQIIRTPGYIAHVENNAPMKPLIRETIEKYRTEAQINLNEQELEQACKRVYKNAIVMAQRREPSLRIQQHSSNAGIVIYVPDDGHKSFVVGDVPGASLPVESGRSTKNNRGLFLPVSSGIAIGYSAAPKTLKLVRISRDELRKMNEAITARSTLIAGKSEQLISSLSKAVPYKGVNAESTDV
jgi:hypothetical protein